MNRSTANMPMKRSKSKSCFTVRLCRSSERFESRAHFRKVGTGANRSSRSIDNSFGKAFVWELLLLAGPVEGIERSGKGRVRGRG